jgi:tellurite resistance protein TerC
MSLWATRGQGRRELPTPAKPPFGIAAAQDLEALEPLLRNRRYAAPTRKEQLAADRQDGSDTSLRPTSEGDE